MNAREKAIIEFKKETGSESIPYYIMTTNKEGQVIKPETMTASEWHNYLDWR
ncbi:MAG: hypothetical protein LBC43_01300 [Bifidobacteriaceae bacterium]|jgi:hypothetical protein|nr:hypothetical protein [Bifidobacteriaceae bacterium]